MLSKRICLIKAGNTPQKTFSVFYMLNSQNQVFNPYLFITLEDDLRARNYFFSIFSREKVSFSLQLLFKSFLWAILN